MPYRGMPSTIKDKSTSKSKLIEHLVGSVRLSAIVVTAQLLVFCPQAPANTFQSNMSAANRSLVSGDNASAETSFRNALRFAQAENNLPGVLDASQRLIATMLKQDKWEATGLYFDIVEASGLALRGRGRLTDKCLLSLDQLCYTVEGRKYWARKVGKKVGFDEECFCLEQVVRIRSQFMKEHPELAKNIESLYSLYLNRHEYKKVLALLEKTASCPAREFDRAMLQIALGEALERAGNRKKAARLRDSAQKFLTACKRPGIFWLVRNKYAFNEGDFEKGLKCCDAAIEIGSRGGPETDLLFAYEDAMACAKELHQYKRAEAYLRKAMLLKSAAKPAIKRQLHQLMAAVMEKQGRAAEAKTEIARAEAIRLRLRAGEKEDLKFILDDMSKKSVPSLLPPRVN